MNLDLMRLIDKQFLRTPFYGVRQLAWHLHSESHAVHQKRIRRLIRLMPLMPIYQRIDIERLWRFLNYECVYLHAWETGSQAKVGVGRWITFYNHQRPRTALGGQPPAVLYFNAIQTDH